jgi:hypothetical protein
VAAFHWWKREIRKRDAENAQDMAPPEATAAGTSVLEDPSPSISSPDPRRPTRSCPKASEVDKRAFGPVRSKPEAPERPAFAELRLRQGAQAPAPESEPNTSAQRAGIEVVLKNGRLLRVQRRSDLDLLLALVSVLEGEAQPC